jgi:DnaJ-domain-containing protein 1
MRWVILLVLLVVAWRIVRPLLAAPRAASRAQPADPMLRDPHVVLGVPPGASGEEITRAYRERMKEYHPDRVAGLGPELRELAHEKTVEIQRAWDALRPKKG